MGIILTQKNLTYVGECLIKLDMGDLSTEALIEINNQLKRIGAWHMRYCMYSNGLIVKIRFETFKPMFLFM